MRDVDNRTSREKTSDEARRNAMTERVMIVVKIKSAVVVAVKIVVVARIASIAEIDEIKAVIVAEGEVEIHAIRDAIVATMIAIAGKSLARDLSVHGSAMTRTVTVTEKMTAKTRMTAKRRTTEMRKRRKRRKRTVVETIDLGVEIVVVRAKISLDRSLDRSREG